MLVPAYQVQRLTVCSILHMRLDFQLASLSATIALLSSDAVLLVDVDNLLDFIVAS